MPSEVSFAELCYWHSRTYGTGVRLPRSVLRGLMAVLCLATPCTNWLLPFAFKAIRRDVWMRW